MSNRVKEELGPLREQFSSMATCSECVVWRLSLGWGLPVFEDCSESLGSGVPGRCVPDDEGRLLLAVTGRS